MSASQIAYAALDAHILIAILESQLVAHRLITSEECEVLPLYLTNEMSLTIENMQLEAPIPGEHGYGFVASLIVECKNMNSKQSARKVDSPATSRSADTRLVEYLKNKLSAVSANTFLDSVWIVGDSHRDKIGVLSVSNDKIVFADKENVAADKVPDCAVSRYINVTTLDTVSITDSITISKTIIVALCKNNTSKVQSFIAVILEVS